MVKLVPTKMNVVYNVPSNYTQISRFAYNTVTIKLNEPQMNTAYMRYPSKFFVKQPPKLRGLLHREQRCACFGCCGRVCKCWRVAGVIRLRIRENNDIKRVMQVCLRGPNPCARWRDVNGK